jgi:hypothetical protein
MYRYVLYTQFGSTALDLTHDEEIQQQLLRHHTAKNAATGTTVAPPIPAFSSSSAAAAALGAGTPVLTTCTGSRLHHPSDGDVRKELPSFIQGSQKQSQFQETHEIEGNEEDGDTGDLVFATFDLAGSDSEEEPPKMTFSLCDDLEEAPDGVTDTVFASFDLEGAFDFEVESDGGSHDDDDDNASFNRVPADIHVQEDGNCVDTLNDAEEHALQGSKPTTTTTTIDAQFKVSSRA